jgi:hypothetical protein
MRIEVSREDRLVRDDDGRIFIRHGRKWQHDQDTVCIEPRGGEEHVMSFDRPNMISGSPIRFDLCHTRRWAASPEACLNRHAWQWRRILGSVEMVGCLKETTGASLYTNAVKGEHEEDAVAIEPRGARARPLNDQQCPWAQR